VNTERQVDAMNEEKLKVDKPTEKKDYEFCDDDCLYCDEYGYCPFSEVKHGQ